EAHQRGTGLRDEVPEVEGVKFGGESSDAEEGEKDGEVVRVAAIGSAHGTGRGGKEGVGIIVGREGRRRGRDQWGWGIFRCAARRRRIFASHRRCLSTACCLQASSLFCRHLVHRPLLSPSFLPRPPSSSSVQSKKGDRDPSVNPHPMRGFVVPRF
ncbi:hypothetical protein Taro_037151, partial [Colocasia esculenta]|nr:hypothetical protein [Colocasia esculenta]